MQHDINKLLQKQMNRKDFLKHIGIGLAAVTGVATVLKAVTTMTDNGQNRGYGASVYGGKPKQSTGQKTT